MGWVFALLIMVVIGFAFLAAAGRLGEMGPFIDDRPVPDLPTDRRLQGADLVDVDFAITTRGYSPPQVDALLARLAEELTDGPAAAGGSSAPRDQNALGWPRQV